MNAPKAPATLPKAKWCADSNRPWRKFLLAERAFSAASSAFSEAAFTVSRPKAYALCQEESITLVKSVRVSRPDGASRPAK